MTIAIATNTATYTATKSATITATTSPANLDGSRVGAYRRVHRTMSHDAPVAPNYLARRVLAGVLSVLTVAAAAVAITGLLASFGGGPASASEVSSAHSPATVAAHVARSGDTMWSIASRYRGDVDHSRYVDALIQLNGGVGITIGQLVELP